MNTNPVWYLLIVAGGNMLTVAIPMLVWAWKISKNVAIMQEHMKVHNGEIERLTNHKQDKTVCDERHER